MPEIQDWFLTLAERGNPASKIGRAWTEGNRVEALVHGATYYPRLLAALPRGLARARAATRGTGSGPAGRTR